jgi:molybdate transport system regulatory protein
MKVRYKLWFEDGQGTQVLGEGLVRILELIEARGSIVGAAKDLKMSYRACWGKVKEMERRFEKPLIEPHVGGGKNRGTVLTDEARKLLRQYRLFHKDVSKAVEDLFQRHFQGE